MIYTLPNQMVKAPAVEAFARKLYRHWKGRQQLYDFRAKTC